MTRTTDELERLRRWQAEVVAFLQDERLSPAEWLKRRDQLVREAPKG